MLNKIFITFLLFNTLAFAHNHHRVTTGNDYNKKMARQRELAARKAIHAAIIAPRVKKDAVKKSLWQILCCCSRKKQELVLRQNIK